MPSRVRVLFADPLMRTELGIRVHQGRMALCALHQWAVRCTGCQVPKPPGTLVERARFYWNRVPAALRKNAQLYIIRERRDTSWRFSDANPWRRGLRPVEEGQKKLVGDWGAHVFKSNAVAAETAAGNSYLPKAARKLKYSPPVHQQQAAKTGLKVGIWS